LRAPAVAALERTPFALLDLITLPAQLQPASADCHPLLLLLLLLQVVQT
jgi:hypothetical protein